MNLKKRPPLRCKDEAIDARLRFTTVYILYTENLDGPPAGTRVRDDDGELCRADGCVGKSTVR